MLERLTLTLLWYGTALMLLLVGTIVCAAFSPDLATRSLEVLLCAAIPVGAVAVLALLLGLFVEMTVELWRTWFD